MDWYFGSNIEELLVPKDQEIYDRFPSPESWPKWGMNESEIFGFTDKGFGIHSKLPQEELNFNRQILSNDEVEVESSIHDNKDQSSSSIGGGYQTALFCDQQLDYELDGLAGFQQMDDLFLSSLMEDTLESENLHRAYGFEPELLERDNNNSTDTMLDAQSISSETYSMGSSKYLKTHAFSPSVDQEKVKVSAFPLTPSNSEQTNWPSLKAPMIKVLAPSEHSQHKSMIADEFKETSLEESVLQDLEMVMTQLTEKTRICFRDAFYRLAKNSRQHAVTHSKLGTLSMESSPWTGQEDKMRPGGKKTMESETNIIDRAIANLMFNKMDLKLNVQDFPVPALASSRLESLKAARSSKYSSNQPQIHDHPHYPTFSNDAEVPILCPVYSQRPVIQDLHISRNPAEMML